VSAALLAAISGLLVGGRAGAALFAGGAVGLPLGLLVAGSPPGAWRGWWAGLAGAGLSVAAATAVVMTPEWARRPLAAGWPAGALAALVGLWLLPLVLLGVAAALSPPGRQAVGEGAGGSEDGEEDRDEGGDGNGRRDARR
jgi:hypothetical protein